MLNWLAQRQQRRRRLAELTPLCEAAVRGDARAAHKLVHEFLESGDPDLEKALAFQTHPAVRAELARVWLHRPVPRLAAILKGWGFVPSEPLELRWAVAVLLDRPFYAEEALPMLLGEPRAWHWAPLYQDALFELFMLNRLPEGLRAHLPGLPKDPATRAAYMLLTDRANFDRELLREAYERAGAGLKARLLARMRTLGLAELAVEVVRQDDLSLLEWDAQLDLLKSRPDELWRLVPRLPPIWAVQALRHLEDYEPARELVEALPDNLSLTPEQVFAHDGLPLAWLQSRELLLSGPHLCHLDLREVQQVSLPIGTRARTWRLSPDAARMAVIEGLQSQYATRLLQRAAGNRIVFSRPPLPASSPIAFSPDSRSLAIVEQGILRLFPTQGGPPPWELPVTNGRLQFLDDTRLLVLGTDQVQLVDTEEGCLLWSVPTGLTRPHVRSKGDDLLIFGDSRCLHVVRREDGMLLGSPQASQQVHDAMLGPGGTVLAAGLTRLEQLDVATGEQMTCTDSAHASHLRFAPDGFRLARARGKVLELVDTFEGTRAGQLVLPGPITEIEFSPDGMLLALGVAARQTHVFAVPPSTSVRLLTPDALEELARMARTSRVWGFLYALARFRMRFELTLDDYHAPDDAFLIEIE